jgi:uncharacterized protein YxeA
MKIKIILAVIVVIVIGIILSILIFKKDEEKGFIGYWKGGDEYKITKASNGYYEIFWIGDKTWTGEDSPDVDFYGKYDDKKKALLVIDAEHVDRTKDKKEAFEEKNGKMRYSDVEYKYWVYDEDKDRILTYYKADYDKGILNGTLDLQKEEECLTRVEGK